MSDGSISRRDALAGSLGLAAATAAVSATGAEPGTPYRRIEIGAQQGIASLRMVTASAPAPGPGEVTADTPLGAVTLDLVFTRGLGYVVDRGVAPSRGASDHRVVWVALRR